MTGKKEWKRQRLKHRGAGFRRRVTKVDLLISVVGY